MWLKDEELWTPPEDFDPKEMYGFVYLITNLKTDKKYIGKKFFWSSKTLPITKTRKRRKKLLVESDWRNYWGSNKWLQQDVEELGEDNFKREILHICKTKGELAYMEMKEQVLRDVLLTEDYYNGIIAVKVNANSVKNLFTIKE